MLLIRLIACKPASSGETFKNPIWEKWFEVLYIVQINVRGV